jgi:hypothetical protein
VERLEARVLMGRNDLPWRAADDAQRQRAYRFLGNSAGESHALGAASITCDEAQHTRWNRMIVAQAARRGK